MCKIITAIVALCVTTFLVAASAETPASISKARQVQVLTKLTPTGKRWLSAEIAKARSTSGFTAQQVKDDVQNRPIQNMGIGDGDIEAVAFIVLMAATNDMDNDLKAIMDGVKLINKQKDGWRKVQDTANKLRTPATENGTNPCTGPGGINPCAVSSKVIGAGLLENDQGSSSQGPAATGTPSSARGGSFTRSR
jgi:hypothetical protein